MLIQLLTGKKNFWDLAENKVDLINSLLAEQKLLEEQKESINDFLLKTLEVAPQLRLTSGQALEHPIFALSPHAEVKLQNEAKVLERLMHYKVRLPPRR